MKKHLSDKRIAIKRFNVFTFDFRNSGISRGDKTTIVLKNRMICLVPIKYVKSIGGKQNCSYGISMELQQQYMQQPKMADVKRHCRFTFC
jgi:hypothetical protein